MKIQNIKALIVDDERGARIVTQKLLENFCSNIVVIGFATNVMEAVEVIKKEKPDVVFLDIEMPREPGYKLISFFEKIDFEIIFVTAYNQYALKAFELSAVDYLLKPLEIDRLQEAIEKLTNKLHVKKIQQNYQTLLQNLEHKQPQHIVINHQDAQKVISLKNLVAIKAQEAYSLLYTQSGEKFILSKNLKQFENLLKENPCFFRSHKSWIINLEYITEFNKKKLELTLNSNLTAKLSRYKKAEFLERFV